MGAEALPLWLQGREASVQTEDDAVAFVNALGFCLIDRPERWPFPYLAAAFPDSPDSVLGRIWFWKDDLHVQRRLYYTRAFGGRPGFISNAWLPTCIAALGEAADELILSGRLSEPAREIYTCLEREGPLPSRELRQALTPSSRQRSDQALALLDRFFIVTKVGLTGRERGTYGYILDLAERWVPEAFEQAGSVRRETALDRILAHLRSLGTATDARLLRGAFGLTQLPAGAPSETQT